MKRPKISTEYQRQPTIPIEYLISEIAAFPLATATAFETNLTDLKPNLKKETGKLWRETEKHITRIGLDLSIDMLLSIRDHFWFEPKIFDQKEEDFGLHRYLVRLNQEFFELRGDTAVPRSPSSDMVFQREKKASQPNRDNQTLRWLSYSLPADLLLGASPCKTCPPSRVEFSPSQVYQNLKDYGVVEPHLHVGAAMKFPEYWVAVTNRLASYQLKDDGFKSPGAEMDEGRQMVPWLLRAAIMRCLLARFLYTEHENRYDFYTWLRRMVFPRLAASRGLSFLAVLVRAIAEMRIGKFLPNTELNINAYLRTIYSEMINPLFIDGMNDDPNAIHSCDPIAPLTRYVAGKSPNPEICFVHRAMFHFRDLKNQNKSDGLFEALFWQVIRMRCIFYRHVVQRPMTPGLMWFLRHYDRIGPGRKNVNIKLLVRSAALNCGLNSGLRALEVRKSPENSVSDMLSLAQNSMESLRHWHLNRYLDNTFRKLPYPLHSQIIRHYTKQPAENLEFGWIIHFEKLRGEASLKGLDKPCWKHTYADPQQELLPQWPGRLTRHRYQYRYANYYRPRKYKAMMLGRVLLQFPRSLKVIRGIDVCTDELAIPGWVLAPIFRYLTDVSKAASQHLKVRFGEDVPPLRKTVHTGEDFVHLLGGLRRVDEAVRRFKLGSGDRIGHGMALGTNPVTWGNRVKRVAMPIEDRLLDLVWEWTQYSTHTISCSPGRMAFVEREIARLSYKIFNHTKKPYTLERMVNNLYNERMLEIVGFPEESCCSFKPDRQKDKKNPNDDKYQYLEKDISYDLTLLYRYLRDPEVFRRGHEVEWFDVQPEVESMKVLQNYLRQTIGSLGIVVEVNPSSNLLIGNIADLKNHPFWRLDPPTINDDIPPVALCIGSDDPLTFATDLRREYALVYESLIDGGLSAREAWEWVDRIRRTGLSSRFTLGTDQPQSPFQKPEFNFENKYRITDPRMPRSYSVIGLDKHIKEMP